MINISEKIQLKEITYSDAITLFNLLKEIYPSAYSHFWKDEGMWYIKNQYSKENIEKELLENNANYYFVLYEGEIIGNFRIIWNEVLKGFEEKKSVKLHRVYLHSKIQGKGVGKQLLTWLKKEAIKKQYELIWLDAMNHQTQAIQFYKKLGYQYHSHCFLTFELLHDEVRKMSQWYKLLN